MSIAEDILNKASLPNDNVEFVMEITATFDIQELQSSLTDYDFWTMMQDLSPPVKIISAKMETPNVKP